MPAAPSHPKSEPSFERIIELPGVWSYACGRLGVHLFQGQLSVQDMDRMEQVGVLWHERNPGKRVELSIILPSDARMEQQERARMANLLRRWQNERVASATVVLAQGLRGAMHRSVLTALMLVAPPPHPAKVFGAIADAVTYLTPYIQPLLDAPYTEAALARAVLALHRSFGAR